MSSVARYRRFPWLGQKRTTKKSEAQPLRVLILVEQSLDIPYWRAAFDVLTSLGLEVIGATVRDAATHSSRDVAAPQSLSLGALHAVGYPRAAFRLARAVRQHGIDVIHANEPIAATVMAMAGWLLPGVARIFHRQHVHASGRQRLLSMFAGRRAHLVMAVSQAAALGAQTQDGVPLDALRVAYSGVPLLRHVNENEIAELRERLGVKPGEATVVVVGRLRPEKGHDVLLRAVYAANVRWPLHLIVVGDGPEHDRLKETSSSLRSGRPDVKVHFVGHQADVALWYAIADVVAVPSHIEAFGLVAAEAMSARKPIVASRVGGLSEVIEDGVRGLLVTPRSVTDLALAIRKVIETPELARRVSEAGRRRYEERFTPQAMAKEWVSCYWDALSRVEHSPRFSPRRTR